MKNEQYELLPIKVNELLPIGATCIIKRLSQAAWYVEIFGDTNIISCWPDDKGARLIEVLGDEPIKEKGFDPTADWWEVIITTKNQKWLSPSFIENDILCHPETKEYPYRDFYALVEEIEGNTVTLRRGGRHEPPDRYQQPVYALAAMKVETRIYPNGQRAPLIEFD